MRKFCLKILGALAICQSMTAFAGAAADIGGVQGGGYSSAIPVRERLQFGELKTVIQRNVVKVPEDYGKLFQITPAKAEAVLWFQNDEGVVRNVVLPNNDLWMIQRSGDISTDK